MKHQIWSWLGITETWYTFSWGWGTWRCSDLTREREFRDFRNFLQMNSRGNIKFGFFFFFFNFYFLIWHGGTVDSWYDKKNHFLLLHLTHQIFLSNEITTMTKLTQYWKVKNQIDTIEMLETKLKIDVEVRD